MKLEKIINSTRKFFTTSLLVGALTLPFWAGNLQAQEPEPIKNKNKVSFFIKGSFGVAYESKLVNKIENIPLEIRQRPTPDDWIVREIHTIEDKLLELYNRISLLSLKLGGEISFYGKVGLILGMGLDLNTDECFVFDNPIMTLKDERKDINMRYYHPNMHPRKLFYRVTPSFIFNGNKILRPVFYSEINAPITKNFDFALGCELFKEKIVAENGQGYGGGGLHIEKRYNLANLTAGKFYASLKYYKTPTYKDDITTYFSLDVGLMRLLKKEPTYMGKQTYIDFDDKGWFVGLRIGH